MPRLPVLRTRTAMGGVRSWDTTSSQILRARANGGELTNSTARTLIIVGVACGAIAAVILIGILIYLIVRQNRRRAQLPRSSRIRNGYTQTRTSSADTEDSTRKERPDRIQMGYKYDPDSAIGLPSRSTKQSRERERARERERERERLRLDTSRLAPRQNSLMQSATSPPPFPTLAGQLGQPIRPHAELRVGDSTPIESNRTSRAQQPAVYVPPAPPSWASIWPTESGWTGPGGVASIRDEDFGGDSESEGDGKEDGESQYALDNRPTERTFGPFKLSASLFGTTKHKHPETDSMFDPPTTTLDSYSPNPMTRSPHLDDDEEEDDAAEMDRLMDDVDRLDDASNTRELERSATGNFTLAFGNSNNHPPSSLPRSATRTATLSNSDTPTRSGSSSSRGGHSRTPSSVPVTRSNTQITHVTRSNTQGTRVTRSSTTRTARTDAEPGSPISTVSGQIMAVLTGRLTTPLLKSVESLRRVAAGSGDEDARSEESVPPMPIRRLPTVPITSIPPVPPIPRHHLTDVRPLPIPTSQSPSPPLPDTRTVPRGISISLGPGPPPPLPISVSNLASSGLVRSASENATTAIRPLPVPPSAL
ncbi:hypothetical protein FRC12_002957 [Ceratobasidium sp. 428]|nr:hypothetical protein FRC09_004261 [Ceratobasidium sp. 395]KAG8772655.1 hypothetical protein FRC12_002957 [Ceratobasidium sp. 428]